MRTIDRFEVNEFVESWMRIFHPEFYEKLFATAREDFKGITQAYEENLSGVPQSTMNPQAAEHFGYAWSSLSKQEEFLRDDYIREIESAEDDLAKEIGDFVDEHIKLSPEIRKLVREVSIAQGIFDRVINPQHYSKNIDKIEEVA